MMPLAMVETRGAKVRVEGYEIDILVQGFPGKTVCHGGLGWSTVAMLRGHGRVILIDAGSFNMRCLIVTQLGERGLKTTDVTDVILTHSHYDHSINWIMFPNARVYIGAEEMTWAAAQPFGHGLVPELYIRELGLSPQLNIVRDGEEIAPGLVAHAAPGHTPGHLMFHLSSADRDVIFTGDCAKNRAELVTRSADMSMDDGASARTIAHVWELWTRRPGTLVIPGHDVPMVIEDGTPVYIEGRRAGISAWFGDDLETTTLFELAPFEAPRLDRRAASA
jgi:glyoxylase-like metal-dependent hydrolase (beta-lactamase superfamily II)